MLNQLEQEIVDKYKEWGFGAYLQYEWLENPGLRKQINLNNYPEQQRLRNNNIRMSDKKKSFDLVYLILLPLEAVNPLKVEQEAWKLLSPKLEAHLEEFGRYIETYSPQNVNKNQILKYLNNAWELLQNWNIISNSYKEKYEKNDQSKIEEQEKITRKLIHELQK